MRNILFLSSFTFLAFTSSLSAQQKTVSGTELSNDDNLPMVGITVSNVQTGKSTTTNGTGGFHCFCN